MSFTSDVAFSDAVKRIQTERGSRASYARMEQRNGGFADRLTPDARAFIAARDSIYLATSNAAGQPYVQHRGGPPGFVAALDDRTLAFLDFVGNRQYITTGNLGENDRAFIFMMDYAAAERLKFWGRARVVRDDAALLERLTRPESVARVEQAIVFDISAWDANCHQHIPPLLHADAVEASFQALRARNEYLEATLRAAQIPFDAAAEPAT